MYGDSPRSAPSQRPIDDQLRARREAAAAESAGTSDCVYPTLERVLVERGLSGDVLDFGAGVGHFVKIVSGRGNFSTIAAIDIMPRPDGLTDSVAWATHDLNEPTPFPACRFDVIVCAEVIEHLENPRAVAREWFRLLKPGGHVLLSTPNNESWRAIVALVCRGHFVLFGDESYPAHITALLGKDIERILVEAGFEKPELLFTDSGGIPGRPTMRWQSIWAGRFHGRRFSDNIVAFARKPSELPEPSCT